MRSFVAYPSSSSAVSPSLFFVSNTSPLRATLHHRSVLYGRCRRILVACRFYGGFGTADSPRMRTDPSSKCTRTDRSYGRIAKSNRRFWTVCRSYGERRETSPDSSSNDGYNNEPAPAHRTYDVVDIFNRRPAPVQSDYGASDSSHREPASSHRSLGAREISDQVPSPVSSGYGSARSFNRESTASNGYGRPRGYVREYPLRAGRLHDFVSKTYGAGPSQSSELLSGHRSSLSYGNLSRGLISSPFRNAKVSVFWDLDNKPPKSSPYHAALYLRHAASQFGDVMEMVAYANRHAFTHIPEWVREQRRDRKQLDRLEQRGIVQPEKPYVCSLCGRRCKTNLLLKKHFKQLHEREHQKRMNRLNALKGKKKLKYRETILPKTQRYKEAASPILVPKVGYGLESDLRRAGIFVKTVQYKPQAADIELKKQMADSMQKGVKCICLVSDDTDFSAMLADARALNLHTVVFGESRSLKRYADFWFPWEEVSRGIPAEDIQEVIRGWMLYQNTSHQRDVEILAGVQNDDGDGDVEHKVFGASAPGQRAGLSAFAEDESMMMGQDADDSSSDDDAEWTFEDEVDELDDDWVYVDDDDNGVV